MMARALAVWLLIISAEVVHGTLRTLFLAPLIGDFRARQVCVFTGSAIILTIVYATSRWLGAVTRRSQLAIGVTWLVLTVAFELVAGRYLANRTWAELSVDFRIWEGGLLPIGLLLLMLSPVIARK